MDKKVLQAIEKLLISNKDSAHPETQYIYYDGAHSYFTDEEGRKLFRTPIELPFEKGDIGNEIYRQFLEKFKLFENYRSWESDILPSKEAVAEYIKTSKAAYDYHKTKNPVVYEFGEAIIDASLIKDALKFISGSIALFIEPSGKGIVLDTGELLIVLLGKRNRSFRDKVELHKAAMRAKRKDDSEDNTEVDPFDAF